MESWAENPGRRRSDRPIRLDGDVVRCGSQLPEGSPPPTDGRAGQGCPAHASRIMTTAARPSRRTADGHPTSKTVTIRHTLIQPQDGSLVKAKPARHHATSSHHLFGSQFVKSRDLTSLGPLNFIF